MRIIDYKEPITQTASALSLLCGDDNPLFFDIETTGFSPANTTLYLIGALWFEGGQIRIRQWFNENGRDEAGLLCAFEAFCKDFTTLVHFNGSGFDLPYLKQKAELLQLDFSVDTTLTQLDIYREIRPYKAILQLENMKQTSIEQYLEISRRDAYSGGELINIYQRYVARPDEEKEQLLLLHNHDDLSGMPCIAQILSYIVFFNRIKPEDILPEEPELRDAEGKLALRFRYPDYALLPKRVTVSKDGIYLNASGQSAILLIPVLYDTLKHFFSDYKNYYYLPEEDMAIHKSVAAFVAPENRKKATKNTCYTKITGAFIPCFSKENHETFRYNAADRQLYQTMDSALTGENLAAYILQCLQALSPR